MSGLRQRHPERSESPPRAKAEPMSIILVDELQMSSINLEPANLVYHASSLGHIPFNFVHTKQLTHYTDSDVVEML